MATSLTAPSSNQSGTKHHGHGEGTTTINAESRCLSRQPSTDARTVDQNNAQPWHRAENVVGATASISSSSSMYSSSVTDSKRTSTVTDSENSGRNSIVSYSQKSEKSEKSGLSFVGVSSISGNSAFSQENKQQRQQKQNTYSFSWRKEKERNPLRWLCRRSDASIRQTCQNKANPQQADLEKQSRVPYPKEAEKKSRKGQQTRRQELGPELIERLEKLEEKIDAFIVCQFSTPRSILSIGDDTLDVQATCGAEGRTEGRSQMPSEEVGTHSQKELLVKSQDEKDQGSRQHVHQCVPVAAEIDSLIKSNKKLSATIDALGSSGLIDLIEMLSYSIERLQSEIASLHQQNDIICSEKTPRTSHEDSNGKQLGLQVHVTQRLATLLGRRDEELKQEKKATEKYKETIEGLEEMIKVLGLEWERAVPLITHSERTNRGRVSSKEDD